MNRDARKTSNLPDPDIIAQDIVQAALVEIANDLKR